MEDGVEEIFEHTLTTIEGKRLKLSVAKFNVRKMDASIKDCLQVIPDFNFHLSSFFDYNN